MDGDTRDIKVLIVKSNWHKFEKEYQIYLKH